VLRLTTILSGFKENVQTHSHIVNFIKRFHVMDALKTSKINNGLRAVHDPQRREP
jgi:hypothetical protein